MKQKSFSDAEVYNDDDYDSEEDEVIGFIKKRLWLHHSITILTCQVLLFTFFGIRI